jgi:hypothetical protein
MTQPNVSALPTQWESHGYRDENARLLVRAIFHNHKALFAEHAFVPVQGYIVSGDDDSLPPVVLTIGGLLRLWGNAGSFTATCSNCTGHALMFGAGGGTTTMGLFGCCVDCGSLIWRTGEADAIMAELTSALEGSVFRVPSPEQFLNTVTCPHTALLEALRSVGAKLLPPDDYGFTSGLPRFLNSWQNQPLARAATWASKGTTYHMATGARVEFTRVVFLRCADVIAAYVERTGCLPELELEIGDGIRIDLPMISQEPIDPVDLDSDG